LHGLQVFSTGRLQTEKVVSLIAAWVALAGGYDGNTYHVGDIQREIQQNTSVCHEPHAVRRYNSHGITPTRRRMWGRR